MTAKEIEIKYFAWIREAVGDAQETRILPSNILTITELIDWLENQGEGYKKAFMQRDTIRVALDQKHVSLDASLEGSKEIAFFPPMTGG